MAAAERGRRWWFLSVGFLGGDGEGVAAAGEEEKAELGFSRELMLLIRGEGRPEDGEGRRRGVLGRRHYQIRALLRRGK
jgi:hypothetical protein